MSSDQIQPEADLYTPRSASFETITGRAWVKCELEFWRPCTVEHTDATGVTVVLDNMDELLVSHDRVKQFSLEAGDLVFCHHSYGGHEGMASFTLAESSDMELIGGFPVFVLSALNEAVEVDYPQHLFGTPTRYRHPLRHISFYFDLTPPEWTVGQRVFAYVPKHMDPPRHLLFPGTVRAVHFDVCVEVTFENRGNTIVPTTLVENLDINVGDLVFSCTQFRDEIVAYRENWSPCRVVKRQDDHLMLQDVLGQVFATTIEQIGVLPRHHQMIGNRLERYHGNSAGASGRSALAIQMMHATHIVRSAHWLDAADDPITRDEVESLISSDPELAWSTESWADMVDDGQVTRHHSILWRGEPTFWWYQGDLRCARPTEEQLEKMIDLAMKLDANVVGPAGEELH